MKLGTVKGSIVSTRKCSKLVGYKLLLIEPYYGDSKEIFVAADRLGAGEGEIVLITTDYSVQASLEQETPIDALVVGIVDHPPVK
ncbi:MAG: EutN/CcmL family microcompartment protein [Clostridia bacterium]|nr:EutN/CcmL family microcompartment protein [Clostridia bacterium]